jgi:hypothetical protein
MPESPDDSALTQVTALATDALYVGVGFAVLWFQRAQVRRRDVESRLHPEVAGIVRTVEERASVAVRDMAGRLTSLAGAFVK